jgi:serine/threonine protein kinase
MHSLARHGVVTMLDKLKKAVTQQLPPGTEIGGFVIEKQLAEGGMGSVYQASQLGFSEPVALKILLPEYSEDREYRQRFQQEAMLMQALRHPHIVPIFAFGEENGVMFFAMHLVRGPSLFELLLRRRFSPLTGWQILNPVAQALDYAHKQRIIHRDIKPGNILVEAIDKQGNRGNHVFLSDFGLSKVVGAASLTKTGVSLGTPHYMAPEQVMGQPLTSQTDVYSLAVVMYEVLTGRLPFYGTKPQEVAFKHVDEAPPSPRSLHPDFPKTLEHVLMRALSKFARDRYATAGEFSMAYARAVQDMEPEARKFEYWADPFH